jgi:hypothetical protein
VSAEVVHFPVLGGLSSANLGFFALDFLFPSFVRSFSVLRRLSASIHCQILHGGSSAFRFCSGTMGTPARIGVDRK